VIVYVAGPFVQLITCATGTVRGPQSLLSGPDHNIQRPATGDAMAAVEMAG